MEATNEKIRRRLGGPVARRRSVDCCVRADQMGHADALSGRQLPHQERRAVCRRRGQGDQGRAQDPGAFGGLAVQASGDQARGAPGLGADRRDSGIAVLQRGGGLRARFRAVPRHRLCRLEEALRRAEALSGEAARLRRPDAALFGAVAAAGHLRQKRNQVGRRSQGPEIPHLQRHDRPHRRARRRHPDADRGARSADRLRHRPRRRDDHLGLHRRRHQGAGLSHALHGHAGLAAAQHRVRQQGGLRQTDAGRAESGEGRRQDRRRRAAGRCRKRK